MSPPAPRTAKCPDHPNAKRVERLIAFDCGDVVPEAAARRIRSLWERCSICRDQMFGGPRCYEHNPLPVDDTSTRRS